MRQVHQHRQSAPDATLFIASGCSHCPAVMGDLCRLLKEDRIARLDIINLPLHPEAGEAAGVRSVPWMRIGPFELLGAHSYRELGQWADRAAAGEGWSEYYSHLLESRRLPQVVARIRERPDSVGGLLSLLRTLETPMAVRIGAGAALEELAEQGLPAAAVAQLIDMTGSKEPQIRADACHYLSLADGPAALAAVRGMLQDPDPQVREIAADSMHTLGGEAISMEQTP